MAAIRLICFVKNKKNNSKKNGCTVSIRAIFERKRDVIGLTHYRKQTYFSYRPKVTTVLVCKSLTFETKTN